MVGLGRREVLVVGMVIGGGGWEDRLAKVRGRSRGGYVRVAGVLMSNQSALTLQKDG